MLVLAMRLAWLALALALTGSPSAAEGRLAALPLVADHQFAVGRYWTWTYYEGGDLSRPYSAETYRVVASRGGRVTIEISSRYDTDSAFVPNTRFIVELGRCYQAFQEPGLKVNFLIDLYPYQHAAKAWPKSSIRSPATAFEEKFNCNPVHHTGRNALYETRFAPAATPWGGAALFQQWPKSKQSQLRSWYFLDDPRLAGVAFRKAFNPDTPAYFEMRLTAWGSGEFGA